MVDSRRGDATDAMHSPRFEQVIRQRVIVTGASGFIGRNVVEALRSRGHEVIGVSRSPEQKLLQQVSYGNLPEGDTVIHLAEPNNQNAVGTLESDAARKSKEALEMLLNMPFKKFIYASSAAVYGDRSSTARSETERVTPSNAYTEIKLANEAAVLSRKNGGGIVCRLTNVIGPGMSEANVLSKVLAQLDSTAPLELFALSPIRDFIWITDAAEAIVALVEGDKTGLFNIGTGVPTSIGELAQLAINAAGQTGREIREVGGAMPQANLGAKYDSTLVLNIEKIRAELGWRPKADLAKSIGNFVREYLAKEPML